MDNGVPDAAGAVGPAEMDEGEPPVLEPAVVQCEVCAAAAAKYKCPRCFVQTCSLACVKRHKRERECTGRHSRKSAPKYTFCAYVVMELTFAIFRQACATRPSIAA
jgi:hypothetical protein